MKEYNFVFNENQLNIFATELISQSFKHPNIKISKLVKKVFLEDKRAMMSFLKKVKREVKL